MEIVGIIILVLTVVAFIALGVYLFLRSDFPKKPRKEGTHRGVKVILWADNQGLLDRYTTANVARAVVCVEEAWTLLGLPDYDKVRDTTKEIGCLLTTKDGFKQWSGLDSSVAASVQSWIKDKFYSRNIPLIVIHEGTLDRVENAAGDVLHRGQPVIHEVLHAAVQVVHGAADHKHEDARFWTNKDDVKQLEEVAQDLYDTI